VTGSAIHGNVAEFGGGVYNSGGNSTDTLTMINSTISGNEAVQEGGGLEHGGAGTARLNNVTIVDNVVSSPGRGGGGLMISNAVLALGNSIVALNRSGTSLVATDCRTSSTISPAELVSNGFNLVQNPLGCTITGDTATNIQFQDPGLGPLQVNGGPTPTHALRSTSPAVDRGSPATPGSGAAACPLRDQRGAARPADGNSDGVARCDIGAFEVNGAFIGFATVDPDIAVVPVHEPVAYTVTWEVPPPLGWRTLRTLDVRFRAGAETILQVRFDEPTGTLSVLNPATGAPGPAWLPSSRRPLQTSFATLHVGESVVDGPPGALVTLTLGVSFKPRAAGQTYAVDVVATDDLGREDAFTDLGVLTVTR
jgi:hypothetical protein